MFTKILVPLDGSIHAEAVLPCIEAFAPAIKATVELLLVVNPVPFATGMTPEGTISPELYEQLVEAETEGAQRYLTVVAKRLQTAGCEAITTVASGQPASAIIDAVAGEPGGALVAMATHGRTGLARFALGSVAGQVVRASAAPVLLVRPLAEQPRPFDSILVPLDGSTTAEAVLPTVEEFALALSARVSLVMATSAFSAQETDYLERIAEQLHEAGVKDVSHRLVAGPPAEAIQNIASREHFGLIAMATHGHSGVRHWVFGSVAEHVLHEATVPTLIVRGSEKQPESMKDHRKQTATR